MLKITKSRAINFETGLFIGFSDGSCAEYKTETPEGRRAFNRLINRLEASNPGFIWKWREADLIGLTYQA